MTESYQSSSNFGADYFATGCGRPYQRDAEWLNFFDGIADQIATTIQPKTVLDAGCAMGFLVEKLRAREIKAFGVDISEYAIKNVHPDLQRYCWVASVTEAFPQKYDLIVCIEVLEHLASRQSEKAVKNLCQHSDDILFSSTPFDYSEATHFNVQPPEYWTELFAREKFFRDIDYDASYITPWAVRLRRKNEPAARLVKDYERKFFLLWKENTDLRSIVVKMRDENNNLHNQLVSRDRDATVAENQLNDIMTSRSWQLIQKLINLRYRLIPSGSRGEWFLRKFKLLK
jgi:hypothetical protein